MPGCTLLTPELQASALKPQFARRLSRGVPKTEQTNRKICSAEYSFHFLETASSLSLAATGYSRARCMEL
ncbi:hypothetical protein REMIM1_CH04081 [Rhizobium etli bv. mimosae str. Mim1]|nr:hypothetical protein REMIM1_CH04081 [Rhizobium etli bv. mimosae str. Mim1]